MSDTASVSLEILIERDRQKLVEGWTPEHDDRHTCNELAAAAAHYAHPTIDLWPTAWDRSWDKTTKHPRRKQLVIAAALIIAEIERLDRKKELQPAMQAAGCQDDDADELYKHMKRDTCWYFWKFVHNLLIHPLLALPWEPKWAQRAHDWTAERCKGGG